MYAPCPAAFFDPTADRTAYFAPLLFLHLSMEEGKKRKSRFVIYHLFYLKSIRFVYSEKLISSCLPKKQCTCLRS